MKFSTMCNSSFFLALLKQAGVCFFGRGLFFFDNKKRTLFGPLHRYVYVDTNAIALNIRSSYFFNVFENYLIMVGLGLSSITWRLFPFP